jgi:hypothetical protein
MNKIKAKPNSFGTLTSGLGEPNSNGAIRVFGKNLTSLEGCPEVVNGEFDVDHNSSLSSLIGGPKEVGDYFSANHCGLTSLEGIPTRIGSSLYLNGNPLTSLKGINQLKEMSGRIHIYGCPIISHILGVFFIKGCQGFDLTITAVKLWNTANIVNKHISKGRAGLLPCTQELIEAGLHDFAQI